MNDAVEKYTQEQTNLDPHNRWELCQTYRICYFLLLIFYSNTKQRERRDKLQSFNTELNHVENKLAQQPNDRDLQTAAMEIRGELDLLSLTLAHGAQVS